ncbi:hypothetical protein BDQ17DRAFT_1329000 [Cyathus striatus]|nr:hypothetical protein BDQ17DRAFT_1329000 [Cyathus striatus]
MFYKAKSFVIQNDVKKVYRSSQSTRSKDVHQGDSQLISNYTQLKMGDIHVLDGRVQVENICNDVIVEVMRLKMELEFLSKLCPHPSIRQVYGIFKCNDATGLVFHDDGTHQRYGEYILSMQPLQRAAYSIKYVRDYIDTNIYLHKYSNVFQNSGGGPCHSFGNVPDQFINGSDESPGVIEFYINSSGRLNTVLSQWNTRRPPGNISQSDFSLIEKIINHDCIIPQSRVSMAQLISTLHNTFLSVAGTKKIPNDGKSNECILGRPVIVRRHQGIDTISYLSVYFKVTPQTFESDTQWDFPPGLFFGVSLRVRQYTCFKLNTNAIPLVTFMNEDCQTPQVLENYTFIHDPIDFGIVSGIKITINITMYFSHLIRCMESNKDSEVYLFVSDPGIDPVDGRVSAELHIYWSLDKSGTEPLPAFSAALNGLFITEIDIRPYEITYWDKFYYEALGDFYKMCKTSTYDVSQPSKLEPNRQGI